MSRPIRQANAGLVVKFTALEEIERALTARVESLPLDLLVQDHFDRKRSRV